MKFKKIKAVISAVLIICALFSVVECKNQKTSAAKKSAVTAAKKTTKLVPKTTKYTDMMGRKVEIAANVKRIVAVRYMDFFYLSAILGKDLDDKLISLGMSFKQNEIDGYKKFSGVYRNLGKMANIGSIYDDAINIESVIKLKPDIIIVDKQFAERSCVKKMIKVGLPVVFTDFNSDPFYSQQKCMKMLGKMLGKEKRVNEMVDLANKKTDSVLGRIKKLRQSPGFRKPKLYIECGSVSPDEFGYSDGDITTSWGYFYYKLGADSISAGGGFAPVNPEKVITSNPDVIIIGGANWNPNGNIMRLGFYASHQSVSEHLNLYAERKGWADLNAIKNHRLYAIHYNFGIYPYNFAGVEAAAKFLYPDEFTDINPEKDMKDFFDKYMPVKYSGVFYGSWK